MKQLLILSGKGGTGKTTIASAFKSLMGLRLMQTRCGCTKPAPHYKTNI